MKISLNWLSDYIDIAPLKSDIKGVLSKLTMRGLEVEAIHDLSKGFDKVIVAHLEVRDRHPNADRLSVCKVNTGKEVLQIVCGAQNMKSGDKVALSMIGANLPNGLKIEKGKIRDVESFGMLCSETELGIADTSEGIIILPQDAPVGMPLAQFLKRDDIVFELNVTPNRGDALSHLGVARELASILGQKLKTPAPKISEAGSKNPLTVTLQSENCYQYNARVIEGVSIKPSPEWLQKRLLAIGQRPINNVVDVTNFVLMEFGTPLHAFDRSLVSGNQIIVRQAKDGEKLPLLDKTEVTLTSEDLVIADQSKPIALAGVMGGGNSEVSSTTKNIILEAAQFSPASVRKTSRRFQKHSDSSHRFERQIDACAVVAAMNRATQLILETAGGTVNVGAVSAVSTIGKELTSGKLKVVKCTSKDVNKFLGSNLSTSEVVSALEQVGFKTESRGDDLAVSVPSYRPDVEGFPDICEEVLRVWGYDKIQEVVPQLHYLPDPLTASDSTQRVFEKFKSALVSAGMNEAVNFSFSSAAHIEKWGGEGKDKFVRLANPLNEDLTTLKTSLIGGLIENLVTAAHRQQTDVRLFEMRPVFFRDEKSDTGVREEIRVAGLITGRSFAGQFSALDEDANFFDLKGILETALDFVGARGVRYQAFDKSDDRLHPAQSAKIALGRGACGFIARLHPKIESEFKFKKPVYVFELSMERVLELAKGLPKYAAISKFPRVTRDLSLVIPEGMASEKITQCVTKAGKPLIESIHIVDLYRGEKMSPGTYSLSISFVFGADRTLEEAEIETAFQKTIDALRSELNVTLRLQ